MILDVRNNPPYLAFVRDPMIVGFSLPKGFPAASQYPVRRARAGALQRLQQAGRRNQRQQEHMNVIGHENPRPKLVVPQIDPAAQRGHYGAGDLLVAQVQGAVRRGVEIAIHPYKCLAAVPVAWGRIHRMRKTAVQMPGEEEPLPLRMLVGEAAAKTLHR